MNRDQKEQSVEELKGLFSSASAGVLVDYQGLSANDLVELRKKLNETQSSMKVLKNTLARIAVKDTPYAELQAQFVRARAMVFSDNPVEQAKVLTEYADEHENLKIHAGLLSDSGRISVLNLDQLQALAKLPSKEELLVQLLFLMQSSTTQFVRTLNEVPAKFVRTLAAIAQSKE